MSDVEIKWFPRGQFLRQSSGGRFRIKISRSHPSPYRLCERNADGMYQPLARFVDLREAFEAAADRAQNYGGACA